MKIQYIGFIPILTIVLPTIVWAYYKVIKWKVEHKWKVMFGCYDDINEQHQVAWIIVMLTQIILVIGSLIWGLTAL